MSREITIGPYSAYAIAVKYGYKGTEQQWIAEQEASRLAAAQSAADASTAATRAKNAQKAAEAAKGDALDAIGSAKTAAVTAVTDTKTEATKAVQAAQDTATKAVSAAQTDAVSAVEKAGSEVLESIPEDYQTTVKKVEVLKTEKAEIDDTTVGADAWSSKHIVDVLCPPISETGNPVQCYPVAGYPLDCKVSWEPTQEGSGTPYPAGGGKNLWGDLIQNTFVSQQGVSAEYSGAKTTGKIPCAEGDNYTLSCATTFAAAPGNIGVLAYFDASDTMLKRIANTYHRAFTLTAPANAAYLRASCYSETDADNVQLEKGSAATAYAPYENIRPIKGRDSVTVERCGENLLNITPFAKKTNHGITYEYVANGGVHISGTATAAVDSPTFAVWHLPPGKYYGLDMGTDIFISILVRRNGANLYLTAKGVFKILAGDVIKYWYMIVANGATLDKTVYPHIVPGSTAPTAYAPYTGQTVTLTLPHTIYGGTVDAVTGEGQETWKLLTLDGTENYVEEAPKQYSISLKEVSYSGKCSHFKSITLDELQNHVVGAYMKYTGKVIFNTNFSSLDEFKHYLRAQFEAGTPIQICYTRTPNVHNPTFTAIGVQPIPALSGVNTVLTDADSATVTGRADPIKRITDLEDAVASMTTT